MIPVYICEDEKEIAEYIADVIRKAVLIRGYPMRIEAVEGNPERFLQSNELTECRGIYFLDVDLKHEKYDGFSLADQIRKRDPRGYIIFITTHGELAFETFRYKLEAMDYILKEDYNQMEDRITACLVHIQESLLEDRSSDIAYYMIKVFDDIYSIPVSEILYFETSAKKHRVVLHSDDMILEYFDNLQAIHEQLGDVFFRSHQSFLVNKKRVRTIKLRETMIELDNDEMVMLSRKGRKMAKEETWGTK